MILTDVLIQLRDVLNNKARPLFITSSRAQCDMASTLLPRVGGGDIVWTSSNGVAIVDSQVGSVHDIRIGTIGLVELRSSTDPSIIPDGFYIATPIDLWSYTINCNTGDSSGLVFEFFSANNLRNLTSIATVTNLQGFYPTSGYTFLADLEFELFGQSVRVGLS